MALEETTEDVTRGPAPDATRTGRRVKDVNGYRGTKNIKFMFWRFISLFLGHYPSVVLSF